MAQNRDWGVVGLMGYLIFWWGLVALLLIFITSNSAPGEPQLAWHEEEAITTTKLAVDIATEAPDADGDKIDYTYGWTKNGEVVLDSKGEPVTGRSISSKKTMAGDVWEVTVTPNDGSADGWGCSLPWRECAGGVHTAMAITIGNTPPRARVGFNNPDADEGEEEIEEWDGRSSVALDLSCFDPDVLDLQRKAREEMIEAGLDPAEEAKKKAEAKAAAIEAGEEVPEEPDPCTYTVQWWPADAEPEEGAEAEYTGLEMGRNDLKKSDRWKVIVVANDGTDDGDPVEEFLAKAE